MGATGSENTGQAAGAAGLLESYGRAAASPAPDPGGLRGNEIRQLLTMTAEDVLPANTGAIGPPDKANAGLGPALRLRPGQPGRGDGADPAEAGPADPRGLALRNPAHLHPARGADRLAGLVRADQRRPGARVRPRRSGAAPPPRTRASVGAWEVEYACGQDAPDSSFQTDPGRERDRARSTASWERSRRRCSPTSPTTATARSPTTPGGPPARPPTAPGPPIPTRTPTPSATPSRSASPSTRRRPRQHRPLPQDALRLPRRRQPRRLAAADRHGLRPPRLRHRLGRRDLAAPLRRRRRQRARRDPGDLERRALRAALRRHPGAELQRRRAGEHRPLRAGAEPSASTASLPTPRESLRVPAIGDIDGDREAEIVATAGEHVYAWDLDGTRVAGLPGARRPGALRSLQARALPIPCFDAADRAITDRQPHQARLPRLAGARRPRRRRAARHRRRRARPAPLRLGRRAATRCPGSR